MKLWAMMYRATQDGRVIDKSSEKTRYIGRENGKPLQYSCCENPINSMKRKKDMTPEDYILISTKRLIFDVNSHSKLNWKKENGWETGHYQFSFSSIVRPQSWDCMILSKCFTDQRSANRKGITSGHLRPNKGSVKYLRFEGQ